MYNRAACQLVLGLNEQKLSAALTHPVYGRSDTRVSGLVVNVQGKLAGSAAQLWTFTADGNIASQVCHSITAVVVQVSLVHVSVILVSIVQVSAARCVTKSLW